MRGYVKIYSRLKDNASGIIGWESDGAIVPEMMKSWVKNIRVCRTEKTNLQQILVLLMYVLLLVLICTAFSCVHMLMGLRYTSKV